MAKLEPHEIAERAADARALLSSPTVQSVLDAMRDEYLQELIQAPIGDLTAAAAHAKVKALEDFRARLQAVVNDEKVHQKYHSRRG